MDPSDALPSILKLVRTGGDPARSLGKLLDHFAEAKPSSAWTKMKDVDVGRDIAEARDWLEAQLARRASTTGVYLGLDTLNMDDGAGHNVEIGGSVKADPESLDTEWAFENSWTGEHHLIRGLFEMHRIYSTIEDLYSFADYALFLGYSGIVLAAAVERLERKLRSGGMGRLYIWGFHDGDLFPLCNSLGDRFQLRAGEG
ncbi:MAG TPA: hypothetical protein VEN81_03910 [Planctomycetota bacterium]|nr:hypothetical protein [Planctomycetota bacterium]